MKTKSLVVVLTLILCSVANIQAAQQQVVVGTSGSKASLDTNFTNIHSNFVELYGWMNGMVEFSATSPLVYNNGVLSLTPWVSQSAMETWLGWTFTGSGSSGYVSMSAAPYSDVACTTGQYGYFESTAYLCTGGFWTSKWSLAAHSNPTPAPVEAAFIQAKSVYSRTTPLTLDTAVTGGNQLIVVMTGNHYLDHGSPSVSGGCATSWTDSIAETTGDPYFVKVFVCSNAAAGSNAVTPSGWDSSDGALYLVEVANVGEFESSAMTSASDSVFASGAATASSGSIAIGVYVSMYVDISGWDAGWVQRNARGDHYSAIATQVIGSGGNYSASGNSGSGGHGAAIFIFKGAGS